SPSICCMTSATRKPSASQSRISRSSTGLSSRASDANRSVTAAALSPRDTKIGVSCLAGISLVPQVMGPCAVRDFTMEWHYMERFGKSAGCGQGPGYAQSDPTRGPRHQRYLAHKCLSGIDIFRLDRDVHELKFPGFGGRIPTASAANVPDGPTRRQCQLA